MGYLMAKNLRASMSGYRRVGLGLSLADLTGAVSAAGPVVKPISSSAAGTLQTVTGAIQNLFSSSTPAPSAAPQQIVQHSAGMSLPVKIGIGVGAAGVGFLLLSALKKRK